MGAFISACLSACLGLRTGEAYRPEVRPVERPRFVVQSEKAAAAAEETEPLAPSTPPPSKYGDEDTRTYDYKRDECARSLHLPP